MYPFVASVSLPVLITYRRKTDGCISIGWAAAASSSRYGVVGAYW